MNSVGVPTQYHQRRKNRGCTHRDPDAVASQDLVKRDFRPAEPDRLWWMDATEHPAAEGKVYLAVVLHAFSRRSSSCWTSTAGTPNSYWAGHI